MGGWITTSFAVFDFYFHLFFFLLDFTHGLIPRVSRTLNDRIASGEREENQLRFRQTKATAVGP